MKTFKLPLFVLLVFITQLANATTEIILQKDPTPPGPVPLSATYDDVTAFIGDDELSVFFGVSVGNATITIYDNDNQQVYQETINTNSTTEVYIPITFMESGIYSLVVSFGNTTLKGFFEIP